jgi:hypothetical protein
MGLIRSCADWTVYDTFFILDFGREYPSGCGVFLRGSRRISPFTCCVSTNTLERRLPLEAGYARCSTWGLCVPFVESP